MAPLDVDIIAYSQTTKKGYIIDPTIRVETGSSQPEDVNKEKINIYLPTVDYFKAKYQLENIEDRDKGSTKVHLQDTVEEMKKFNARRKLKGAVLAAVSSPKWTSFYSDPNSDGFSDFGEDEVTSSGAVSLVLDSLDDIHCLQEAPLNDRDFLHSVLEDRQLHALLETHIGEEIDTKMTDKERKEKRKKESYTESGTDRQATWQPDRGTGRSLGYGTTSFDGEIIAISESLRNLLCHINKFKNAVILSDSKAAILSIVSKHTPSSQTAEITKMLSQLISLNKRIVFQWIPSHCGILGNENADALAKKGSTATYRPVTKSTYYSVKRFIKSTYLDFNKQNLIIQSQGKKWNSLHHNPQLIPDLPRKSSVAAFRLAIGHDCLAKHLYRIGIYQSPNCPLCNSNQEMDSEHLKTCASVADHDNIFENIGVQEVK
ncbi:hypothetical protein ANN_13986 [Periplaneta americana]|uniref:RNase H type-1 domain-containing protein n=1 Tax=Periplaneta americana TaxID=6978 RepID=A0ABQ8SWK9_PERAM|nr:hypothetical protein ANN_13986 [Periplaneta americana]